MASTTNPPTRLSLPQTVREGETCALPSDRPAWQITISNYFAQWGPQAYGQVFIAWGFAGLVAPWCAGLVYDLSAGYGLAMLIAAAIAICSATSAGLFRLGKSV